MKDLRKRFMDFVDLVSDYFQAQEKLDNHVGGCCECAPGNGLCEDGAKLMDTCLGLEEAMQEAVAEVKLGL